MRKQILVNGIVLFFLLSVVSIATAQEGYSIKIKINGLKDTTVILGHYLSKGGSLYPDDTIKLDKKGTGVFSGEEKLSGGMYLVILPNTKYFDFILDKDQHFSMETDTLDLFDNLVIKDCEVSEGFLEYQKFLVSKSKQAKDIRDKMDKAETDGAKEQFTEQLKKIDTEVKEYLSKTIEENADNFLGIFIKATQRIEVPDPPKDENGNILDSLFQYKYYKSHYFDNFDISDVRLLRTPLYEDKVMTYIDKVVPQVPDSIIGETDMLIEKSRSSDELFRFMLITLFNHYAKSKIMGMDAVYIHLAEKYYIPEANWSEEQFISDLKERVKKAKPTLIGRIPPNEEMVSVPFEHFLEAENDTALKRYPYVGEPFKILDDDAKYTVLLFWECDCGHCKKEVPKLYGYYVDELKELDTEVISIHMLGGEEGKEKWIDFVNKHQLYEWKNVWSPYSYQYKLDYDIHSTPVIFLLDKDKKIIAKRLGAEQVKDIIKLKEENKI